MSRKKEAPAVSIGELGENLTTEPAAVLVEINRQNPFQSKHAFGMERVTEGNFKIDLRGTVITVMDKSDGTRDFYITSPDEAVTVTLTGLTSDSNLVKKP